MIQNSKILINYIFLEKYLIKNMFLLLIIDFSNYINANQFNKF